MAQTSREYVLEVGELAVVKRSFLGASYSVIYAGLPQDSVYSVVVSKGYGYQALAYNLFLPLKKSRIKLPEGSLLVTHVSEDEIRFRVE